MLREQVDALMTKEMTRRDFLSMFGTALLALFGISALLEALIARPAQQSQLKEHGNGFGKGYFGR